MAWFDAHADGYDDWFSTPLGGYADAVEKELLGAVAQPKAGEEALDLGCGTGVHSIWLAEQGLTVTGLDESEAMLDVARAKTQAGGPSVTWVHGDAARLPFPDSHFDLVISVTALEFVDDRQAVLREVLRVLRPGGRLALGLLTRDSAWGELYAEAGLNPDAVFSRAHLFTEKDLVELDAFLPGRMQWLRGLYWPPTQEFDSAEAARLEATGRSTDAAGAGFWAVGWVKEDA